MSKATEKKKLSRIGFGGVFPPKSTFDKAHLKAYLKGKRFFNHGFSGMPGNRYPISHPVKELIGEAK